MSVGDALLRGRLGRRLLSPERQRRHWRERVAAGPLADYYRVPFASPRTPSRSVDYLALDLETTGFEPASDEIVAIGFVLVREHAVRLETSGYTLVRPSRAMPESSAIAHGILDDRASTGIGLGEALPEVLAALAGRVLLAHHAPIEYRFLDRACRRLYGHPLVAPVVDTLELERRALARRDASVRGDGLRLAALRERYGLPRYRAHDALVDAVAAAELLLAQIAHRARPPLLGELTSVAA